MKKILDLAYSAFLIVGMVLLVGVILVGVTVMTRPGLFLPTRCESR